MNIIGICTSYAMNLHALAGESHEQFSYDVSQEFVTILVIIISKLVTIST